MLTFDYKSTATPLFLRIPFFRTAIIHDNFRRNSQSACLGIIFNFSAQLFHANSREGARAEDDAAMTSHDDGGVPEIFAGEWQLLGGT